MRIFLADTFFYPRGGSSNHAIALGKLLREKGHEVFHYAMHHPKSLPCPDTEKYFAPYIEFPELLKQGWRKGGMQVIKRTFYSKEVERNVERMLTDIGGVDVAHVHNFFHQLTPSIFEPFRKRKIPIIVTLHDYTFICPNTSFFDERRGHVCHRCLKGGIRLLSPFFTCCKKNSFSASAIASLESIFHRLRRVPSIPDLFIAPSRFIAERFVDAGFPQNKIKVIPNFFDPNIKAAEIPRSGDDSFALYAGRLSHEKGVATLIEAWQKMPPECRLKIAGTGPLSERLKEQAKDSRNIEFLGFVPPEKISAIRAKARFTIVPSEWWENAPLTIIESFADGIPVLGANIGGIPELVVPNETGVLFEPGNAADLKAQAFYLWNRPERCIELGANARETALSKYTPEKLIPEIINAYKSV